MAIPRNLGNLAPGVDTNGVLGTSKGGTGSTSTTYCSLTTNVTGTLPIANGGTGQTTTAGVFNAINPMTTTGDLIYEASPTTAARLPIGTTGQVLSVSGGIPTWTTLAASGTSVGTLQYFSGSGAPTTDATWLRCNGSVFTKSTYTALSAAIGNIPNSSSPVNSGQFFSAGGFTVQYTAITTNGTNYYTTVDYDFCGTPLTEAYGSTNGATWNLSATSPGSYVGDLQFLNNLYVAIRFTQNGVGTNELRTSTNFSTWTTRTVTTSRLRTVRYLNNLYVTAGDGGFLATSTNAVTWTSRTSGTTSTINGLAYGNGLYAYCGNGGVIATSTDAITWTARTSNTTTGLSNLIYANSKFNAVGSNVTVQSTDGTTWTANVGTGANIATNYLVYGYGNLFYAAVFGGVIWSNDAIHWGTFTTATIGGQGIALKTNEIGIINLSGNTYFGNTYNPFSYNTSTQFVVPNQQATTTTTRIVTDNNTPLYIKAS